MLAGAMIVGVGFGILSGGAALAAGLPLLGALGCYAAGGTAGMLGTLAAGASGNRQAGRPPRG